MNMNKILKYLSIAAIMVPVVSCTEEKLEIMDPATLTESVSIVMDTENEAKIYIDSQTGSRTLPMIKGESIQLEFTTVPEDLSEITFPEMKWEPSDESVITVDESGLVTAVKAGEANITISPVTVNTLASATLHIKVVETAVPATGIEIDSDATMTKGELPACYIGETMTLTAAITPAEATYRSVLWSSGDEAVATVDPISGVVTGVSVGNVTITATALDAENPATETFDIYIDEIIMPLGIRLDNAPSTDDIFSVSDQTFKVEFTTNPASCTLSQIDWTSSDETVATVENGVVTFKKYGTVRISAICPEDGEAGDGFAKSAEFTLNIPAGYYDETADTENGLKWEKTDTRTAITYVTDETSGNHFLVQPYQENATKSRGDIRHIAPTYLHSNYPILCFRMDDLKDDGLKTAIKFDTSGNTEDGTKLSGELGGGDRKWKTKYKCTDGSSILIYDLATQEFREGILPAGTVAEFVTFQFKYADITGWTSAEDTQYRFFWFKTFQSEDDLNAFLSEWSSETGITYTKE